MVTRALMATGLAGLVVGVVLAGLLSQPAAAATGINKAINFQGKLVNTDGTNIPNGTYNIEFKLYTAGGGCVGGGSSPCGGTLQWTEDHVYGSGSPDNRVTVTDGVFQVDLGAITTLPAIFNDDTIWLSINLGDTTAAVTFAGASGDDEMLPFIRFTAAPYALNSDLLDGLDASAFAQLNPGSAQAGSLHVDTNIVADASLQAPLVDTSSAVALGVGTGTASSVTVGRATSATNLTLQGSASTSWTATGASGTTTIAFNAPTANTTLKFPASAAGNYTICTTDAGSCSATYQAAGNYLAKNAIDTSSFAVTTAGDAALYKFTNSSSAVASGVLQLDNGSNTSNTLSVTAAASPAANKALVLVNDTLNNATGNLIDLWSTQSTTSASRFAVDTVGNVTQAGGTSTTDTINGQRISSAANFTGTVTAATSLLAPLLDTASAGVLAVGTTNATAIDLNQDTVLAAGKSLRVTGDVTANRPASPTEGMVFYDTTTKQLITYSNGKWQSDRSTATKIVAASNASQAEKDGADYIATGTNDQTTINTALTAASGGRVYLTDGTFSTTDVISIPNNTTLAGAGRGTIIQFANIAGQTKNMITNTDTATGTGVTVRDLQLDGNRSVNTTGTMDGIHFDHMGAGTGSNPRQGALITGVWINNFNEYNLYMTTSGNTTISNNTIQNSLGSGLRLEGSNRNNITGNLVVSNGGSGIVAINSGANNSSYNVISSNNVVGNSTNGIYVIGDSNTITGNNIRDNGGSSAFDGIKLTDASSGSATASNNTIVGNTISDTAGTGYAIDLLLVTAGACQNNYLASNYYTGTGATTMNDTCTGTIYGGQLNSSGAYVIQPAGGVTIDSSAAGQTFAIANSAVTHTIQIGTGAAVQGITIGSTNGASSLALNAGTGGLTIQTQGTGTLGIGNNAVAQTLAIGNNTGATSVNIQAGTGNLSLGDGGVANSIQLGNTTGAVTQIINIGNNSTASSTNNINIGSSIAGTTAITGPTTVTNRTSGSSDTFVVSNSTSTGNVAVFKDNSTAVATIADGGATTFKNAVDSASAFLVQNLGGADLFKVDTSNTNIVAGSSSGDVRAWSSDTTGTISARDLAKTATVGGYVYTVGGCDTSGSSSATVQYAKIAADGSLGNWGTTTSIPANACLGAGVAAANGYLYVTNYNGSAIETYYAKPALDGTVSAWTTSPVTIASGYQEYGLTAYSNYLYVLGGTSEITTVQYSRVNPDGTIGAWAATSSLALGLKAAQPVVANGYMYMAGGNGGGSGANDDVQRAKINADGTLGSWSNQTNVLPDIRAYAVNLALNGYLYVISGAETSAGTNPSNTVYYAPFNADGTVGSFTSSASTLPAVRWLSSGFVANGYLYVISGTPDVDANATTTTYYTSGSRVQVAGSLDLIGISGEELPEGSTGGQLYAGDTYVAGLMQVTGAANFLNNVSVNRDLSVGGMVAFRNATNSATAFAVQDSLGAALLAVDTATRGAGGGNLLKVGNSTGTDGATTIFQLDSSSANPTSNLSALNGGLYYNSNTTKLMAIENGAVQTVCTTIAVCSGYAAGTGTAFLQNGNSFSATAVLGTNDAQALELETGGVTRLTVSSTGSTTVASGNSFTVTSGATTLTGATSGDAFAVSNSTSTGNIAVFKDNSTTVARIADGGGAYFQNAADSTNAFNIETLAADSLFKVDTTNSRVGINLRGTNTPTLGSGVQGLEVNGAIRLSGGATASLNDDFTTPVGTSVKSKINIPLFNPGNFGQILAFGLPSGSDGTARAISVFDDRAAGDNQPPLNVFAPNENNLLGLSWDGSNTTGYLKVTGSNSVGIKANGTAAATFSSSAVSLLQDTTVAANKSLTLTSGTGTFAQTYTGTTTDAHIITANSLTTGTALKVTSASNSAANSAWSAVSLNVTNNQGTTAVSTGTIAGLDLQYTQNTSVAGNTKTVANFAIAQNNSSSTDSAVSSIINVANNDTATGNQITAAKGVNIDGANVTDGVYFNGTFGTNLINSSTGNFVVAQSGAVTAVGVNSGSGLIQGTGGETTTGTIQLNASGAGVTTIGNASSGALTVAAGANSTINTGSNSLAVTSSNFNVSTGGVLNVVGGSAGFQIGGAAASGDFLRGNGTSFVAGTIQATDATGVFVKNVPAATSDNTINPGANNAVALTVRGSSDGSNPSILDIRDSGNTQQAFFNSAGSLNVAQVIQPTTNNAVDLGVTGTNTFRTGYFGTSVIAAASTLNGTSLTFGGTSNATVKPADQASAATAGVNLTVQAAAGNTSGVGGNLVLNAGAGGNAAAGGNATIQGGAAGGGNTAGGTATVQGGTASGTAAGGAVTVQGGTAASNASSIGGAVTIVGGSAGATAGSQGGAVAITGGAGTSTGTGAAGNTVTITGGAAGGSGNNAGGATTVQGGQATGTATGGLLTLQGGAAAAAAGSQGGSVSVLGRAGSSTGTGGAGGNITITAGAAAGSGANNGGSVTIAAGAASSTGVPGVVSIAAPVFTSVSESFTQTGNNQTFTSGTDPALQTNLDAYGTIVMNVTGAYTGATVTMPSPTNTAAGRVMLVSAASGSVAFTLAATGMSSVNMSAGNTATLVWNGSGWSGTTTASSLQQVYNNTSTTPASIITTSSTKNILLQAGSGYDNANLFQIGNSVGAQELTVDTTNTATGLNLMPNSGAETATGFTTTYPLTGFGTVGTEDRTTSTFASGSAAVYATPTAANSGIRANLGAALTTSKVYNVSFTVMSSTAWSDIDVRYNRTGTTSDGAAATCSTASSTGGSTFNTRTVSTTAWTKIVCYLTTSASAGDATANIVIFQTASTSRTIYVDNIAVVNQNTTGAQDVGVLQVGGTYSQGLTLMTLDSYASTPWTGAGNTNLFGSMYYDTTAGLIKCYQASGWGTCGAAPNNNVGLIPEYGNAVLNGTIGAGGGTDSNIGTMTANICSGTSRLSVNTSGPCAATERLQLLPVDIESKSYRPTDLRHLRALPVAADI